MCLSPPPRQQLLALSLMMTGATPVWDPHFIEILRGSFSAVSTATIARVGASFHIFRDLQDLHAFAPLQTQNINYFSFEVQSFFIEISQVCNFHLSFLVFQTDFDENASGFQQNFRNL